MRTTKIMESFTKTTSGEMKNEEYPLFNETLSRFGTSTFSKPSKLQKACPQKLYTGQAEAQRRRILRDHLFSGRIFTLAKMYNKKPLPVFEKPTHLVNVEIDYFGKQFTLKMSEDDHWTRAWISRLSGLSSKHYQFDWFGAISGAVSGSLGLGTSQILNAVFKSFMKTATVQISSMFIAIGLLIKSSDTFVCVNAMTLLLMNLGGSLDMFAHLAWPLIPSKLFFQSSGFSWIPSAVGAFLTLILGGCTALQFLDIMTKTSKLGMTMGTIVGVHRILTESLKELWPYVYKKITGSEWEIEQLAENLANYTTFVTSVEEFEQNDLKDIETSWEAQMKVYSLQSMYRDLVQEAHRLGLSRQLSPLVAQYYSKVTGWLKRVTASGISTAGARQEPVSVLIAGKPGIGKSYMVQQLVTDVLGDEIKWTGLPGESIVNHIYMRNPMEQYWSNYRGQKVVLYDDFGQLTESESNPDPEFGEIIQAIGDNPYKIPVAELEEKNRAYFRSEFVVATTNLDSISSRTVKSIRCPEALARRFSLHVTMMLDQDRTPVFMVMQDDLTDKIVSYTDFVNMIRGVYREKKKKFADRTARAQIRTTSVPHQCIAKYISYTSAPSSVAGTKMIRKKYNPRVLDHSYCHESLPCRQEYQANLEVELRDGEEQQQRQQRPGNPSVALGLTWFERLKRLFKVSPVSKQYNVPMIFLLWEPCLYWHHSRDPYDETVEIWETLDEICAQNGIEFDVTLDELMSTGLKRRVELLRQLHQIPEVTVLYNTKFPLYLTPEEAVKLENLEVDTLHNLAIEFELPLQEHVRLWQDVMWHRIGVVLSKANGIFRVLWSSFWGQGIGAVAFRGYIIGMILGKILWTLVNFIWHSVQGHPEECTYDLEADLCDEYMTRLPLFGTFNKTVLNEKRQNRYESRDQVGAQKSHKGQTMKMSLESKDQLGDQKTHKGQTIKMTHEAELETSHLRIHELLGRKYVLPKLSYGPDGVPTETSLRKGKQQYMDLLAAVSTSDKYTPKQLNAKMAEFFEAQAEGKHYQAVMEANGAGKDLTSTTLKMEPDLLRMVFQSWNNQEREIRYQGSTDQNADGIGSSIERAIVPISAVGSATQASLCFFYAGRNAWVNKHTYLALSKYPEFDLWLPTGRTMFYWRNVKSVVHPVLDIALIQMPKTFTPFPDARKHIAADQDLNWEKLPAGRLITKRGGVTTYIQSPYPFKISQETLLPDNDGTLPSDTTIGYYHMNTVVGDCGAPFMALDPTRQRKIFGFHYCGNAQGMGSSMIITSDLIVNMEECGGFNTELQYEMCVQIDPHPTPGILDPIGCIPTPFEPTKTKIRASTIQGEVTEPTTKPTITRQIGDFDPMRRGIDLLHQEKIIVPDEFIEEAQGVLTRYISGQVFTAKTLSIEQALSGKDVPGLEPIELSTSAGLPLCMEKNANGKRKWILDDRTPTPEFKAMVEDFITQLKEGKVTDVPYFKETLKDERVAKHKADYSDLSSAKTRLFSASPLVFLTALRMYYGSFMGHATTNPIRNSCTTGINPYGADWQLIADYLQEVSPHVDDGDYSGFDTSQPSGFLIATYNAIRNWYNLNGGTVEDDIIRERLAEFCYHPIRVARGTVYRTNGSLPSGMFGTTVVNSGVNMVAFFFAFKRIYPEAGASEFLRAVRTVTHGDDVLFAVHRDYKEFTSVNIGLALRSVNMKFTPAAKDGKSTVARPIEEVTFLKRGFKKIGGFYRAPLATSSSLEMVNWITKSSDNMTATKENCEMALRELAISEDTTDLQQQIIKALYQVSDGMILLPVVGQAELCEQYRKNF